MSYILDALKKSEQESNDDNIPPGLHSIHTTPVEVSTKPGYSKLILFTAIILIVLFAAGIGALMGRGLNEKVTTTNQVSQNNTKISENIPAKLEHPILNPSRIVQIEPEAKAVAVDNQKTVERNQLSPETVNAPSDTLTQKKEESIDIPVTETDLTLSHLDTGDTVIRPSRKLSKALLPDNYLDETKIYAPLFEDLSSEEREQIPAIEYSGHIYSSSVQSRFSVINGRTRYIGDEFDGVKVISILEGSVILDYNGILFTLNFQ